MANEKYEREAERIARRFYSKDWHKLSGRLREEIYQMAVDSVNWQEGTGMDLVQQGENWRSNKKSHKAERNCREDGAALNESEPDY